MAVLVPPLLLVIPAKAGIFSTDALRFAKDEQQQRPWIPAFAGMTSKSGNAASQIR